MVEWNQTSACPSQIWVHPQVGWEINCQRWNRMGLCERYNWTAYLDPSWGAKVLAAVTGLKVTTQLASSLHYYSDSSKCIICAVDTTPTAIPTSLAPFFQEYDLTKLVPERDSFTIIERVLQFGNRAEIKWLFNIYSQEQIESWVRQFGNEKLRQPHRTFWKAVLEITD